MRCIFRRKVVLLGLSFVFAVNVNGQLPYQNPHLSSEQRAKDLIGRLTLKEKASLMLDQSPAIPRLGIKKFNWWSEALHGLANNSDVSVFPEPIGMAASFDNTSFEDYSMKRRTYRYMSDPLFPFGFGLSYTKFSIGNAQLDKTEIKKGGEVQLTIPVSNIGKRKGTEIVQV
ncbi:hypothetical protein [Arachidicoccus sp.]|uniref:hypothetical protein n=1 Tax=Arachidicoccus sp. TaxID=1872624 RepID=UPI003D19F326